MSDSSHRPVRRIGTRAAVRQEASNMAESNAAPSVEPAPPATPKTESPNNDTPKTDSPNNATPKTDTPNNATPKTDSPNNATPKTDSPNDDTPNNDTMNTDSSDNSPTLEPKLEFKQEPMDTSPPPPNPAPITETPLSMQITPIITPATLQLRENLLLAPLGPSPFTGRKRKANFSNEETETLVRDVVKHFSALYGSEALRTESTRRNQRRSQLWTQIQRHVNELGYTPRSIDDLKHKWRDLRLEVKRKITHGKTATKVSPAPGVPPIIDTKLNQLEDLVASTIGHHCTLDGEQEGMYMEPGVPRQSIFFTCRPPSGEMGSDRMGSSASPRPTPELSVMSPLVSTSPAHLSFVPITENMENGDHNMDVTQNAQIKTLPEPWPAVKEMCTLVTTQNLISAPQTIVTVPPEILTVKQEVLTAQPILVPVRCESQDSVASSLEGSVGNPAGQTECNAGASNGGGGGSSSNNSPATSVLKADAEMVQLKVENDGDSQDGEKISPVEDEDRGNWQENPDEWGRESQSPHSETVPDDSLPSSSSQDGDPSSGGELPTNGDCSFNPDERKSRNMNRLLELEEQWDRLYHRELGIWEEERIQQQQQRNQDRELQQQLLSVLTDIRDELRQLRQERAAARQTQAIANGSVLVTNASPTVAITPKPSAESPAETPTKSTPVRRRGRPRLIRPAPEPPRPVRPIRPAPEPANS